jgi:DNA-binding transcriptional LysR family regulator
MIGVNEGLASSLVPRAVDTFHQLYPNVTFSIKVNNKRQLVSQLREGDIDFAVGYNFPADADLQFVEKFSLKMFLIVASEHPLGAKSKNNNGEPEGHQCHSSRQFIAAAANLRQFIANVRQPYQSIVETNSFELIYALVEVGIGVGIVTGRAGPARAKPAARSPGSKSTTLFSCQQHTCLLPTAQSKRFRRSRSIHNDDLRHVEEIECGAGCRKIIRPE